MDIGSLILFGMGSVFGIIMASLVSDLVFPPSTQVEDEDSELYS